jgi:hypothetical protein
MFDSWTLICATIISIEICPFECGKLNVRSSIPIVAPKVATLRISKSGNVIVPSVNKFGSITKSISFYSSVTSSIDHNTTNP